MNVKMDDQLTHLYESDETAWLDAMAEPIRDGRTSDLDFPNLADYLDAMAKRDRREVNAAARVARTSPQMDASKRNANSKLAHYHPRSAS